MVLLLSLFSSATPLRRTFFGFDTFIEVELPRKYISLFPEIDRLVRQYDALWNRFSSESLITRINTSHLWIPLDSETFHLLKEAVTLSEKTRGMFCPLIGGLMDLWGFSTTPRVPDPRDLARELQVIRESTIMFDEERKAVARVGEAKLDLGGIAKGYFVDLLVRFLRERGVTRFLINAGGTVFGAGKTWEVGILHPRKRELLGRVKVRNLCVSTSADSFRFFEKDGNRYHHILNPKNGYPGKTFISVTVIAPRGSLADALSTAIMAGDEVFLSSVLGEFPGIAVLAVKEDGSLVLSPSMRGLFQR
ncbi:FAD:protein FMN transferase [Candidatus Caldatribacterium sp.]|uniref:FAD:protein FMN transferase n=1 Tax=Candidatus Caldatribacterium sp. TaxID=2282143 RepID=UPI0029959293|nr:FAD:protein FMN transferase [Candidatus Caldatribacterium sp.]MDW8080689.1 FAD:protein FMN transferase [Candidatus Calescibacterium sp.]